MNELTDRLGARDKLRQRLLECAAREQPEDPLRLHHEQQQTRLEATIAKLGRDLATARRNYATEADQSLRPMIREEWARIEEELNSARATLATISEPQRTDQRSPDHEADQALSLLDDIRRIAGDPSARAQILPLMQRIGLRIGLQFVDAKKKFRRVRRLVGGLIVLGDE